MLNRPRRNPRDTPPVMLLILPGVSLMDVQLVVPGVVVVRCPGCGASQLFAAAPTGEMTEAAFVHQDERRPIRLRIEAALAKARAAPDGTDSWSL